jgi:hypothetical protein
MRRPVTRTGRILIFLLMAGTMLAKSQTPAGSAAVSDNDANNPVAHARNARSWEYGPFANWGTGLGNRDNFKFFWAGVQVGKALTPVVRAGIFSGQFELSGNIMPLWQAYTPPPHEQTFFYPGASCPSSGCGYVAPDGGGTYRGVSLTPVILRWNFLTRSRRFQPWFQGAGGLIYTTHKFPPDQLVPQGTPGGTSVWNFSPQGGFGAHYFVRPKRSIDLGINAVHISSASLGDRNPGVNASLQIQVGYTYWK